MWACGVCAFISECQVDVIWDGSGPSKHLSVTYLVSDGFGYKLFRNAAETSLAHRILWDWKLEVLQNG